MKFEYTFANEDSYTEQSLLPKQSEHVLAIAGSGSRVIPLFAKMPEKLTCIDSSQQQLALTEFRIEALRALEYVEFCKLLGYQYAQPDERKKLFEKLSLTTQTEKSLGEFFRRTGWQSLLFSGAWELKLANSARLFRLSYPDLSKKLINCDSLESQKLLYLSLRRKLKLMAFFLTLSVTLTVLLKKLMLRRTHLSWSSPGHFYRFFTRSISHAFENFLIKNNFYYSALLTGSYKSNQAPTAEIDGKYFSLCKKAAKACRITYINSDIIEHCEKAHNKYNFISLSNVPDYLKESDSHNFMNTLEKSLTENGILVYRRSITSQSHSALRRLISVSEEFAPVIRRDTTPFYNIYIYRKTGPKDFKNELLHQPLIPEYA
ncbi:DUF3419 family protein [Alteromonas sp. 1_MG-2023]|uniref:DUF3419 family protein n=1 Tax=Alteromonas sp. 1_MG-2023 TaxID=3062669 RepID=UPI0026E207B3|nr:DUF3419 family protein [Alteromonas sp. 1_MG-2023]MDO6476236.1 DUF3419 family protein [Alteromonas sp. 1_MG-2023]